MGWAGVHKFLHIGRKMTSVVHSHPPSDYIRKQAPAKVWCASPLPSLQQAFCAHLTSQALWLGVTRVLKSCASIYHLTWPFLTRVTRVLWGIADAAPLLTCGLCNGSPEESLPARPVFLGKILGPPSLFCLREPQHARVYTCMPHSLWRKFNFVWWSWRS